jgi:cell wall-associated NlpC family hydrolase
MDRSSTGASGTGSPHGSASASCAALRSDSSVGTAVLTKDDAVSPKPVSLRPALTRRAAVVAGSAAAAALFATVPAAPAAAPAAPPASPTVTVSTAVVPLAARSATITLDPQAVAAAAPAAARRSAMQKALGKVGSPYRYGAAGPNAFDCSGLVTWAFKSSGKSLPRTSSQLSRVGAPVSKSALQPGDLVFFYKPISHVGIYIGNGKIVHASRKGQPVKVSDMGRMKFTKAVRL